MVSECLREDKAFGVCLIHSGNESGVPATVHTIGTTAKIFDWDKHDDGTLLITVRGDQRFRLLRQRIRKNNLIEADIQLLDHEDDAILPAQYQLFSDLLRQVLEKFELPFADEHEKFDDPYWVGCRLAEILPVELDQKQVILEMDNPLSRLQQLQDVIEQIGIEQESQKS